MAPHVLQDEYEKSADLAVVDKAIEMTVEGVLEREFVEQVCNKQNGGSVLMLNQIIPKCDEIIAKIERMVKATYLHPDADYDLKFLLEGISLSNFEPVKKDKGMFIAGSFVMPDLKFLRLPLDDTVDGMRKVHDFEGPLAFFGGERQSFIHNLLTDSNSDERIVLLERHSTVTPRIPFPVPGDPSEVQTIDDEDDSPLLYGDKITNETMFGADHAIEAGPTVTRFLTQDKEDPAKVEERVKVKYPKEFFHNTWFGADDDDERPIFLEEHTYASMRFLSRYLKYRVSRFDTCGIAFDMTMKDATSVRFLMHLTIRPIVPAYKNVKFLPYMNLKANFLNQLPKPTVRP